MKYVIFLGDGMADEPHERFGGRTVLQAARKPHIDRIAREGRTGMFRTVLPGMDAGSASANLAVMGYDVNEVYQGRAVLEAASMGIDIPDGAIGMRCNVICIENGRIKNHSAGHISTEESAELLAAMKPFCGDDIALHAGVSYRNLLVGRGLDPGLDTKQPHDYPGEEVEPLMIAARTPEAEATARRLNALTRKSWEVFADHPVNRARVAAGKDPGNSIWLWSPGRRPKMWTYQERFGIGGAVISAVDLIFGLGRYAGLEMIHVEGATGLHDTNYEGKADACLAALERHDFVYLHVEAPDEAGHEGDVELKKKTIEDLDERCIGRVMAGLEKRGIEATLAVLPDHPTPAARRVHTRDPIPFAIRKPGESPDPVQVYDEVACREGDYGEIQGDTFIKAFFGRG